MRKALFFIFIVSLVALSGCGRVAMDELGKEGTYRYRNKDMGFALSLLPEFEYYQTQRKDFSEYRELEIFVPTTDTAYQQEVPGYAKPIVVRILKNEIWEKMDGEERTEFSKIGEKRETMYLLKFWDEIPDDWAQKWSKDMESQIIDSFQIY